MEVQSISEIVFIFKLFSAQKVKFVGVDIDCWLLIVDCWLLIADRCLLFVGVFIPCSQFPHTWTNKKEICSEPFLSLVLFESKKQVTLCSVCFLVVEELMVSNDYLCEFLYQKSIPNAINIQLQHQTQHQQPTANSQQPTPTNTQQYTPKTHPKHRIIDRYGNSSHRKWSPQLLFWKHKSRVRIVVYSRAIWFHHLQQIN